MSAYARPIYRETVHCSLILDWCIHYRVHAVFNRNVNNHKHASYITIESYICSGKNRAMVGLEKKRWKDNCMKPSLVNNIGNPCILSF